MSMRPEFQVRLLAAAEALRAARTPAERDEGIRLTLEVYDDAARYAKENFAVDRIKRAQAPDPVAPASHIWIGDDGSECF